MIPLSQFMRDLRDSESKVLVKEKQLREYTQNTMELIRACQDKDRKIKHLQRRIEALEAVLASQPDTIDLFA